MSKELDELERGIIEFEKNLEDDCNNEWLKRVVAGMKKCYQRLEAIDKKRCGANVEKVIIDEFVPSNELEKEYLEDLDHYDEGMGIHSTSYEKCKERLIRLAKIDNAKPSEALKGLDKIYNTINLNWKNHFLRVGIDIYNRSDCNNEKEMANCLDTIKQTLIKAQEQEKENAELKRVLEVIKNKNVNVEQFMYSETIFDYNYYANKYIGGNCKLTQEEFDLLKKVLGQTQI